MKTIRFALIALAAGVAIAACGEQPTTPMATEGRPSFNGIMLGSGHRSDDSTSTATTSTTTTTEAETDTTGRGGIMLGSGH